MEIKRDVCIFFVWHKYKQTRQRTEIGVDLYKLLINLLNWNEERQQTVFFVLDVFSRRIKEHE